MRIEDTVWKFMSRGFKTEKKPNYTRQHIKKRIHQISNTIVPFAASPSCTVFHATTLECWPNLLAVFTRQRSNSRAQSEERIHLIDVAQETTEKNRLIASYDLFFPQELDDGCSASSVDGEKDFARDTRRRRRTAEITAAVFWWVHGWRKLGCLVCCSCSSGGETPYSKSVLLRKSLYYNWRRAIDTMYRQLWLSWTENFTSLQCHELVSSNCPRLHAVSDDLKQ